MTATITATLNYDGDLDIQPVTPMPHRCAKSPIIHEADFDPDRDWPINDW